MKLLIFSFNCSFSDQSVPAFLIIFDSFSEDGFTNDQGSLIAVSLFDFASAFQTMMWSSKFLQWIFSISCLHGVIGRQYEPLTVVCRGVSFPQKVMMLLAVVNWISHFFSLKTLIKEGNVTTDDIDSKVQSMQSKDYNWYYSSFGGIMMFIIPKFKWFITWFKGNGLFFLICIPWTILIHRLYCQPQKLAQHNSEFLREGSAVLFHCYME